MKIASFGLYNPLPINSGVDSYISFLLNSIGEKNDITHYYFFSLQEKNGHYPKKIHFRTQYIKSNYFIKFQNLPKLLFLLRPDLLIDKQPLKNIKSDVVICDTITYHVGQYVAKINKSPLILIKHNIEWKYLQDDGSYVYPLLKAYEHYTLQKAEAIITISTTDYQYITNYVNEKKVTNIPPSINTDIFTKEGESYNFGSDAFNILFYGSLDRTMNIEALKFIKNNLIPELQKQQLLHAVRINIFGSGTPPEHLNLKFDNNINYLGSVDNPGKYIRGADLVIVPVKNTGGMKIRLLETLFCEKPIIATPEAVKGLPLQLKKMIYIENDAEGFSQIIKQLIIGKQKIEIDMNELKKFTSNITLEDVIKKVVL